MSTRIRGGQPGARWTGASPARSQSEEPALLQLQRTAGNRAVAGLVAGGPSLAVQRWRWGFGGSIPVPEQSDAEEVKAAGGQARWQHRLVGSNLTTAMLTALAEAGNARGMVELLRARESDKARTLQISAAALGGPEGGVATGGDIDWKHPWQVQIADNWRLQSAVATVAHEVKHNEQWYVRFGRGKVTKDGESVPMDDVELASFEIPAKRAEAQVMAAMAVRNVAERKVGGTVYQDGDTEPAKRAAALAFLRQSAKNPVEEAALSNALIYHDPGTVQYDWHFFFPYLLRYALDRYREDLKKTRAVEALLAQEADVVSRSQRLATKLGWSPGQAGFDRATAELLRERSDLLPLVKQVALAHVEWFEAVRKNPGSRPIVDTGPTMQAIDDAVLRLVDLRDRTQDPQPY